MRLPPSLLALVLFLCHCSLVIAQHDRPDRDAVYDTLAKSADEAAVNTKGTQSYAGRPEFGTKDAPVDGLDGKPHAGPFVDNSRLAGSDVDGSGHRKPDLRSGASTRFQDQVVPEDGVMNDPNRKGPKEGTTGTEGGVSEKTKNENSDERPKRPEPPKDASAVAHFEKDGVSDGQTTNGDEPGNRITDDRTGAARSDGGDASSGRAKAMSGMEKPDDFSWKQHNQEDLDRIDPGWDHKIKSSLGSGAKADDDDSDDDEDEDERDGIHDFIPWDSFLGSFSSIAATEIGDKTFIVAALMAMRYPRLQVFTAAYSALFIMTILSGFAGHLVGAVISKKWAAFLAALLFLVFGAKSLKEGYDMDPNQGTNDEIQEVQAELEEKEAGFSRANGHRRQSSISPYALEAGRKSRSPSRSGNSPARGSSQSPLGPHINSPSAQTTASGITGIKNLLSLLLSPAWVETFSMTFIGELGDRSQIATVAMAAGQEYWWVMVGASLGHFVCTVGAVVGGSVLAGRVSMRKVTLMGGTIFIGFGIFTLVEAVQYMWD